MWGAIVEALRLIRDLVSRSTEPAGETPAPYVDSAKVRQDVSAGEAYRRASHGPFRKP